jgi:nicotinamidase-related amidase
MSTIRPGHRPVLLVVDVQAGVVATAWEAPRVVSNVARVVARAREQSVPVIWVQHDDEDLPRDSAAWQLAEGLAPAEGEARIDKQYNSSFEATELDAELARREATHIVLAGAASNWCIRATAYGALERGYDLTLVKDAHTTRDIELPGGAKVEAARIVDELNIAMKWLSYPGRSNATATADEVDFGAVKVAA